MDERNKVQSAITHINNAKAEIENFPRSGLSQKSLTELDLALIITLSEQHRYAFEHHLFAR